MADKKDFQNANYPLPAYNFRVTVGEETVSFLEVSGVNLECETVTYRDGLSFWEGESIKSFHYNKYVPITLKKGTVKGRNFFYEWINEKSTSARSMEVNLCDEKGEPVVTWKIATAVPVKLLAPDFDANTNDVSIESLELMVAGISIVHH